MRRYRFIVHQSGNGLTVEIIDSAFISQKIRGYFPLGYQVPQWLKGNHKKTPLDFSLIIP
jgi:hypothetical protein